MADEFCTAHDQFKPCRCDKKTDEPTRRCLAHLEDEPCETCAAYIAGGL